MSGLFGGGGGNQQQQAPASAFNVQTSAYGLPVPLLYGRNRLTGNIIWYGDFVAIPHKSKSAGKGGGSGASSTYYTYTVSLMLGLCEGVAIDVSRVWKDKDAAVAASGWNKFYGGAAQSAWSYMTTYHPTQSLNYRGHCYVSAAAYDLGESANTGNHTFEVTGLLPYNFGASIFGANPKDVVIDYLTDLNHGSGFPSAFIGDLTMFSNYCIANSFFISPLYNQQQEARQTLNDLFDVLNTGIFFSEGKLKAVPYSDTSATGNSITYTPIATPVFAFTDDDYLDLEQPVTVQRISPSDAYNQVQMEFLDATNSFNKSVQPAQDQASIEIYGLKAKPVVTAHMITDAGAARTLAQLILQRILFTRNMYELKVGWKYCQLEPCDYVTITDSRLGLVNAPVRVLGIEEDEYGQLTLTVEDAPSGVSHTALYDPQPSSGYVVDYNVAAGNIVAPQFFEVPASHALSGLAIGVAATGNNANWGGCDVYVSNDSTNYSLMGTVNGPARYGSITGSITSAIDQIAHVALVGMGGQIFSGSNADAANDSTSCLIGDEFMDFTTASLISTNNYDLTMHVRGSHGTAAAAHASAERFIRMDDSIAYSDSLDLSTIGKTLSFKFASFNIYGGAKQNLASLSAYTYTVRGNMAKLAPALVSSLSANNSQNSIFLSWNSPVSDANLDHVEIWSSTTNVAPGIGGSVAALLTISAGPVGFYADYLGSSGITRYYWLRTINPQGYPSAFTSSVTGTTGSTTMGNNSITNAMLQTDAVQAVNIQANAVTSVKVAANSIIAGKINANAITAAGGEIADLTVQTIKIVDQAVTFPVSVFTAASVTITTNPQTIQSATIVASGAPILVSFSAIVTEGGGSGSGVPNSNSQTLTVFRGATLLATYSGICYVTSSYDSGSSTYLLNAGSDLASFILTDTPTAGSHTYSVKLSNSALGTIITSKNRGINLLETKK